MNNEQNKELNLIIKEELAALAEPDYRLFSSKLLPGVTNILGVRLPNIRGIAKRLAKGDWKRYLSSALDDSMEEVMLQGMTIGYVKAPLNELLPFIQAFVPKINNWSVCDSFCSGLKITKQYKTEMYDFLLSYLTSEKEYDVRFAVVMLLNYYIEEPYLSSVLSHLDSVSHPAYYVKMAVAWAISMCYVKFPDETMPYLLSNTLDTETYNKALQKITESLKVSPETKKQVRMLKR
ncbi:MAG: DNA alkylation repair protein [Lachnospiraceae bacterium]|nr:DNA alkylation repair protein [Lachnospiraceae bacterium]